MLRLYLRTGILSQEAENLNPYIFDEIMQSEMLNNHTIINIPTDFVPASVFTCKSGANGVCRCVVACLFSNRKVVPSIKSIIIHCMHQGVQGGMVA